MKLSTFENEEILTSTLLSDIVYLENRRLNEINEQEKKVLPLIKKIDGLFALEYNIKRVKSESDLKSLVDLAYNEILPKLKTSKEYNDLIKKKHYFNWERNGMVTEYHLGDTSLEIDDTAIELKRHLLIYMVNRFTLWVTSRG